MLSSRLAFCLLAGVLATAVLFAAGGSAGVSATQPEAVGGLSEGVPSTHDGAVGASQPTIPGAVTTQPVFAGDRVLLGTDRGLAVFSDGELVHHVETQPVRRVVPTGDGTAIVLVENAFFSNVHAVDLDSGSVEWRSGRSVEVYSPDFGNVDRQARPSDAAPVGDVSGDGTTDVAVTLGQSVVTFDGASGDVLWTHEHAFNLWELDAADGTVYAGTQDGKVLALDAASGDTEFERQLVEPFDAERDDVGTPHRSVWTVTHATVGGESRLVATGEDGSAHLLNAEDGSPVWSEQVLEFDDQELEQYYGRLLQQGRLTLPGDATFSAVEATVVDGSDGTDVAVSVAVEEFPRGLSLESNPQRLTLLDGTSGQQQWTDGDIALGATGSIAFSPAASALVVPQRPDDVTQPVVQFDAESGERTTTEYQSIPPRDRALEGASTAFVATSGDRFALVTTSGDLRVGGVDGTVDWSYPAFQNVGVTSVDLTDDGIDDYLFRSGDATTTTNGPPQSRGLVARDGSNGTLLWSVLTDAEEFNTQGGFATVQTVPTREGPPNLLAIRQPSRENDDASTGVAFINGKNGSIEAEVRPDDIRFQSAVALGSVSDRRTVLVAFDQGIALLGLDGEGEYAGWSYRDRPEQDIPQWNPFGDSRPGRYVGVGDGDDDGTREVVAVSREGGIATVSVNSPESIRAVRQTDLGGNARVSRLQRVGDLTGDGYEEVAVSVDGEDDPVLALYAPGQGEVIERIERGRPEDVRRIGENLAGQGEPGAALTRVRTDSPSVTVYAGMEGVLRHEFGQRGPFRQAGVSSVSPAATAGDVDGDGNDEVAIVEASTEGGARVNLTNTANGEVIDSIELERFETENARTTPGLYAQPIPDRNGDDSPELGVVTNVAGSQGLEVRYYVVDPQAGKILLSGDGRAAEFVTVGERNVGVVSPDGSASIVDPTDGVTITNAEAGTETALSWEFDGEGSYVTRVYVDGYPVTLTNGTETTVRLPPGEHTVQVRATNAEGVTVYATTTVTVEGGSSLDLLLFGGTLAAVLLLLVPYARRKYRRRQ